MNRDFFKKRFALLLCLLIAIVMVYASCGANESPGGTNLQEENVDEGDIVKFSQDGKIFNLQSDGITVTQTHEGGLTLLARQSQPNFVPVEMFITQTQLVTIGGLSRTYYEGNSSHSYYRTSYTQAVVNVYDLTGLGEEYSENALELLYTLKIEAQFNTSRIYIQTGALYLMFTKSVNRTGSSGDVIGGDGSGLGGISLSYSENSTQKSLANITYFKNAITDGEYMQEQSSATIFFKIDLNNLEQPAQASAYYGAKLQTVYASEHALYPVHTFSLRLKDQQTQGCMSYTPLNSSTLISKLDPDTLDLEKSVQLRDLYIYGRHALKDDGTNFYVVASSRKRADGSAVFVLGANMNLVGERRNIAPYEDVKSVRYEQKDGDMFCYIVTFRQTDPLFKVDLSRPTAPVVTGELEIDGFSTYLHTFAGDRAIGLGLLSNSGRLSDGIKVTLFDTSGDDPVYLDHMEIYSTADVPALYNPRAFCVDNQNMIFGFSALKYAGGSYQQGFYIFAVVGENDDRLADIAYLSNFGQPDTESYGVAENYYYDKYESFRKFINRAFYRGDYAYAVADGQVTSYVVENLIDRSDWTPYQTLDTTRAPE